MTTKIPNRIKILIVLKKYDVKITSSDLAEYCHINTKNIGRYLDKLAESKYISRKTIQAGKKRYIENKILAKGKNLKLDFTYNDVMKEIELTDMKEAVEVNQHKGIAIELTENVNTTATNQTNKELLAFIDGKFDTKSEILMIIKTIAIRTQDAHKLGFKTHEQLTKHLIELILKL